MKILYEDQLVDRDHVKIDLEDRGYQFGDGVYEVIRVYNGQFFTLREHLERFERSANELKMELSYSVEKLESLLKDLVLKNDVEDGGIYLQLTRGISPRQHNFPVGTKTMLTAYPLPSRRPEKEQLHGVKVKLVEDVRWLRCDIKSLNLLGNVMAKQEAKENGAFEALLHRNGTITEGSSTNFYLVKDGVIYTHPATNLILNGITRLKLMEIIKEGSFKLEEKSVTLEDLKNADEAFITSTTIEVVPVVEADNTMIGNGEPGPITRKLQSLFLGKIESEKSKVGTP
ncbi:D-amino-acid transaminase [Metabacillus arenae]|uniref:D-alanine aminotransferase n=1 Tax=Metabacillus arenae TaxID=2771434 RepID=A0A926NMF9_9BACI|nr:D-amino-acid transaminase [Metabacillus arenae]MBD1383400.1 D-amino-acid transaminase [Metabacillus arenae]